MVVFNGVSLESKAPVSLIDITEQAPEVQVVQQENAARGGAHFARRSYGTRAITLTLALPCRDMAQRAAHIRSIVAWATSEAPKRLELPQYEGLYLNALCTSLPGVSAKNWWDTFEMEFTALDPAFYDGQEHSAALGEACVIGGTTNAKLWLTQRIETAITHPRWQLSPTHFIELAGEIAPGELLIDFDERFVTLGGVSLMQKVSLASRFFSWMPGERSVTGTSGAAGMLHWQERWL